jgi:hypothetical protein
MVAQACYIRAVMTAKVLLVACLAGVSLGGGCKKSESHGGLPPAKDWKAGSAGSAGALPPATGGGMAAADPHAGMDMGGAGDPHAGMDMGGVDMGAPAGPVGDPNHFLRGTITLAPALKDKVPVGGTLFVYAKRPDPADPEGQRMPVASSMIAFSEGVAFDLNEASAMAMPGGLQGELILSARYSKTGNVSAREHGEFMGSVKVTAPKDGVVITIDTPVTPRAAPANVPGGMQGGMPGMQQTPPATTGGALPPGHP